jgi:hypothetical protein
MRESKLEAATLRIAGVSPALYVGIPSMGDSLIPIVVYRDGDGSSRAKHILTFGNASPLFLYSP